MTAPPRPPYKPLRSACFGCDFKEPWLDARQSNCNRFEFGKASRARYMASAFWRMSRSSFFERLESVIPFDWPVASKRKHIYLHDDSLLAGLITLPGSLSTSSATSDKTCSGCMDRYMKILCSSCGVVPSIATAIRSLKNAVLEEGSKNRLRLMGEESDDWARWQIDRGSDVASYHSSTAGVALRFSTSEAVEA